MQFLFLCFSARNPTDGTFRNEEFEDTSIDMEAVRRVCLLRAYKQVIGEAECWCVIRRKVGGKGETKREISRRETGMTAGTR